MSDNNRNINRFMGLLNPEMIKGFKAVCEKHGDISEAAIYFDYKIFDKEKRTTNNFQSIYCLPCLNEFLMNMQKEGKIPKVMLYEVPEENEKNEEATIDNNAVDEASSENTDNELN